MKAWEVGEAETHFDMSKQETTERICRNWDGDVM